MPPPAGPTLPGNTVELLAALGLAAVLAAAIALIAGGLVRRLLAAVDGTAGLSLPARKVPIRLVRLLTFVVSMIALVLPALSVFGVTLPVEMAPDRVGVWAAQTALRVGVVLLLATIATRVVAVIIGRAEQEMTASGAPGDLERRKRAQTIGRTFSRFLSALIWVAALLMVLRALDVDITPVLTGAGIIGLAVGFGAQTLVKDVISGIFIILEDQVRVGDVAIVNGTTGEVGAINLRTLVLRDLEGTVHVFPNGEIRTLANRSKDFAFYLLDVGIDYQDDVDQALDLVRTTADVLRHDAEFGPLILEPLEVMGVQDFGASAVMLRFRIKTVPLNQWRVGRELRRRIKKAFDREGIRIPVQQVEVKMRDTARPSD